MSIRQGFFGVIALISALAIAHALVTGTVYYRGGPFHRDIDPARFWICTALAGVVMAISAVMFVKSEDPIDPE